MEWPVLLSHYRPFQEAPRPHWATQDLFLRARNMRLTALDSEGNPTGKAVTFNDLKPGLRVTFNDLKPGVKISFNEYRATKVRSEWGKVWTNARNV